MRAETLRRGVCDGERDGEEMKTREERRRDRQEDIRDTLLGIAVLGIFLVVAALEGALA